MTKNTFVLWRAIGVFAVVALIGFVAVSCDTSVETGCGNDACGCGFCPTGCECAGLEVPSLDHIMNNMMVRIYAGSFTQGQEGIAEPTRQVTLTRDFYIGKHVVTQELFQAVMGVNPSRLHGGLFPDRYTYPGDEQRLRPVETVNWYHAIAFANRLSILKGLTPVYTLTPNPPGWVPGNADSWLFANVPTGNTAAWNQVTVNANADGFRLPTEAEWEFAARAGNAHRWGFGNDETELGNYAWYGTSWVDNADGGRTRQVGQKRANPNGLFDMHGNVWEWVWDRYLAYPEGNTDDPTGPPLTPPAANAPANAPHTWPAGGRRVARGGGWASTPEETTSAYRNSFVPTDRGSALGFRIVRNIPPALEPTDP